MTGKKIRVMIGIAAGEERRIAADKTVSPWMEQNIERVYPLIGLGWDREACKEYIRSLGYQPVAPSLCRFCPYKTKLDLLLMSKEDPEGFDEWAGLETNKLAAHERKHPDRAPEKNHGVFGQNTTLPGVLAEVRKTHGHLSLEELREIRMTGHHVGSAY